jgi:hypothetical protein
LQVAVQWISLCAAKALMVFSVALTMTIFVSLTPPILLTSFISAPH